MQYTLVGSRGFLGQKLLTYLKKEAVIEINRPVVIDPDKHYGTVIYCAGIREDFNRHGYEATQAHVMGVAEWLQQAQMDHFMYLSSTRVYQDTDPNIHDIYNLSKRLGEALCLKSNRSTAVIRLSHVLSSDPGARGFFWQVLQQAKQEHKISLQESPIMSRDYILLDEMLLGLKTMSETKTQGIIHFASGLPIANHEIIDMIKKEVIYGKQNISCPRLKSDFPFSDPRGQMKQIIAHYLGAAHEIYH
jgi:nucleoside-diphosphate-sugar epimerase